MAAQGQFYTHDLMGAVLIRALRNRTPKQMVDLGAGLGALTKMAQHSFKRCRFTTIETDQENVRYLRQMMPTERHLKKDVLTLQLPNYLSRTLGSIDTAISNPPFISVIAPLANRIIKAAGMPTEWPESIKNRAEVLFFAQALRVLNGGGEIGLILPDTLLSGNAYRPFRDWLFTQLQVSSVIELPRGAFHKTDAKAFILIAQKQSPRPRHKILLGLARLNGEIEHHAAVSSQYLLQKGSLRAAMWGLKEEGTNSTLTLGDVGVEIFRGKPRADLLNAGMPHFHTTDFKNLSAHRVEGVRQSRLIHVPVAIEGDILIPRVGRNCYGATAVIASRQIAFSDCILCLRVPEHQREQVWQSLRSPIGQAWRQAHMQGVAASFLRQSDLLNMPLFTA